MEGMQKKKIMMFLFSWALVRAFNLNDVIKYLERSVALSPAAFIFVKRFLLCKTWRQCLRLIKGRQWWIIELVISSAHTQIIKTAVKRHSAIYSMREWRTVAPVAARPWSRAETPLNSTCSSCSLLSTCWSELWSFPPWRDRRSCRPISCGKRGPRSSVRDRESVWKTCSLCCAIMRRPELLGCAQNRPGCYGTSQVLSTLLGRSCPPSVSMQWCNFLFVTSLKKTLHPPLSSHWVMGVGTKDQHSSLKKIKLALFQK